LIDQDSLCPPALVATRRGGSDPDRYVAPTRDERDAIRDAITMLVKTGPPDRRAAERAADRAGFEIVDLEELPGTVLVREVEARRRGGGAYLVRFEARARTTAIGAPHTFFDEGTLPIAYALFQRTDAVALFINTAHRYKTSQVDREGGHPSDVAHNAVSLFQAATDGLVRAIPSPTIVQLHGFARANGATVVVSAGETRPGDPLVARVTHALANVMTGVLRYPEDSEELGATTNVQGELVRKAGGRFLHVELESNLRRAMLRDQGLRARLLDALAVALDDRAS
jgi:hypothetical protein